MSGAVRPCLSAALVGAGVLSSALAPMPSVAERVSSRPYSLTASAANVPGNLISMVLSIPAWEVEAMNSFADAMVATGSWQVWGPNNVLGFDELDPPKLKGLIGMMMPVKPFSAALADQLNVWAQANLPMDPGCAARPGACPNPRALLKASFTVPISTLTAGYRFPTVRNPFTGEQTSWSGTQVKLDPGAPGAALRDYLTGPPRGVEGVSVSEFVDATVKLAKSMNGAFSPLVQNSEWFNPEQTGLAPLFKALAPVLCPTCDPVRPYNNPWLYQNYPPKPASGAVTPAPAAAVEPVAGVEQISVSESDSAAEDSAPPKNVGEAGKAKLGAGVVSRRQRPGGEVSSAPVRNHKRPAASKSPGR